jgi:hypothetical protein
MKTYPAPVGKAKNHVTIEVNQNARFRSRNKGLVACPQQRLRPGLALSWPDDTKKRSLQNLIFERDAFGIVLLEPPFGGFTTGEHLEVVDVTNFLAGVDAILVAT